MKWLYRCLLYSALLLNLLQLIVFLFFDRETIVLWWVNSLVITDKEGLINQLLERIPLTVSILPGVILLVCGAVALYKERYILAAFKNFFKWWKDAIVNLFRDMKRPEFIAVITIPFLASLYFAANIPVSYDEAITYNLFTSKPFFYCMIFYPYPNNHVLHSLLTNLTEYIPFVNILFGIRIPAIVASLFTWLIGYSFLKKYYSSRVALLVVGVASAMYMSIYYSFMSRGYAFMVLAFVVCLYAAYNIIYKGSRSKDWMFLVVTGVLGCYTIPSFLYPFATVNVLILIYNHRNIKQQIIANAVVGICIILLYMPIMLVDGVAALTSNQFVQHVSRMDILIGIVDFYKGMFTEISGIPFEMYFLIFAALLLAGGFAIYQKDKQHVTLWVLFIVAPCILLLLHAVNPFYRTFLYYNFIMVFLVVVPLKKHLDKIPKLPILIFIILLQVAGVYYFNSVIGEREGFNTDAKKIADTYFDQSNTIIFPCISSANYEFEAKVSDIEDRIHFLNNETADVDTINNCSYVIISKNRDKTTYKRPYDSIGEQNIYKNER